MAGAAEQAFQRPAAMARLGFPVERARFWGFGTVHEHQRLGVLGGSGGRSHVVIGGGGCCAGAASGTEAST